MIFFIWGVCGGLAITGRGIENFLAAGDFLPLSHSPVNKSQWHLTFLLFSSPTPYTTYSQYYYKPSSYKEFPKVMLGKIFSSGRIYVNRKTI